jgi:hypothetical protein
MEMWVKSERGWEGIALTAAEDETVEETPEDSSELPEALD